MNLRRPVLTTLWTTDLWYNLLTLIFYEEGMTPKKKEEPKAMKPKAPKTKKEPMTQARSSNICTTCSVLPVGSTELASLLLVLVFSLVSVLFTAVLALDSQQQEIATLEAQLESVR